HIFAGIANGGQLNAIGNRFGRVDEGAATTSADDGKTDGEVHEVVFLFGILERVDVAKAICGVDSRTIRVASQRVDSATSCVPCIKATSRSTAWRPIWAKGWRTVVIPRRSATGTSSTPVTARGGLPGVCCKCRNTAAARKSLAQARAVSFCFCAAC